MAALRSPASNVRSRRASVPAAAATTAQETPAAPRRTSSPGYWKSLSLRRCRRLFRLPHGAKAAAILVRLSIAARGATQAAAAGAAPWPHHLKRQERSREPRCGGGLGRRREAGAELPRWREPWERRRRNAGRAGDGPGLPRAPCTHRRTSAGRCVRPSRVVFVISPARDSKGAWSPPPASVRRGAFCPLGALRLGLWVRPQRSPVARCPAAAAPTLRRPGGFGPGLSRRAPAPASVLSELPLGLGWAPGVRRSVMPEPRSVGPFSFGKKLKSFREGPHIWAARSTAGLGSCRGALTGAQVYELRQFIFWAWDQARSDKPKTSPYNPATTSVPLSFIRTDFLALHVAKRT